LVRRALDSGRVGAYLAVLVFGLAMAVLFGAVAVWGAVTGNAWVLLLVGLPALGGALFTVSALSRWWWGRQPKHGAVVATAPSGRPATAYLRSRAALLPAATTAFGFLALGIATTVMAVLATTEAAAVVGAAVAAYSLLLVLPFGLGPTAGGVYLTREGVEHRWGRAVTAIPWSVLLVPRVEVPFGLWLPPGAEHRTGRPLMVPTDVTDQVPKGYAAVPPAYLPLTAQELVDVLEPYRTEPHLQAQLGTVDSTLWDLTGRGGAVEL
jgi:hypothetical protein